MKNNMKQKKTKIRTKKRKGKEWETEGGMISSTLWI